MPVPTDTPDSLEERRWAHVACLDDALVRPWLIRPPRRDPVVGLETSMAGILAQVLHEEDGAADELWALARANPQAVVTDESEEKKRAIIDRAVVRGAERVLRANSRAAVQWVVRWLDPIARELARTHSAGDQVEPSPAPTLGMLLEAIPESESTLSWLGIEVEDPVQTAPEGGDNPPPPTRYLELAWTSFVDHVRVHPDAWPAHWEGTTCSCHATGPFVDALTTSTMGLILRQSHSTEKSNSDALTTRTRTIIQGIQQDGVRAQEILRPKLLEVARQMDEQVPGEYCLLPGPVPGSTITACTADSGELHERLIAYVGNDALLVTARVDVNGGVFIDDVESSDPTRRIVNETELVTLRTIASTAVIPILTEAISHLVPVGKSDAPDELKRDPLAWLPVPMISENRGPVVRQSGWIQLRLRVVDVVNDEIDLTSSVSSDAHGVRILASAVYPLEFGHGVSSSILLSPAYNTRCFLPIGEPPSCQIFNWIGEASQRVDIQRSHHRWFGCSDGVQLKCRHKGLRGNDRPTLLVADLFDPTSGKLGLTDVVNAAALVRPDVEYPFALFADQAFSVEELRFRHYAEHDRKTYEQLPRPKNVCDKGFPQLNRDGQRKTAWISEDPKLDSRLLTLLFARLKEPYRQNQCSLGSETQDDWFQEFLEIIVDDRLNRAHEQCCSFVTSVTDCNTFADKDPWEWDSLMAMLPLGSFFRIAPIEAELTSIASSQGYKSMTKHVWPMPDYYRPTTISDSEGTYLCHSMVFMDDHRDCSTEEIRLAQYQRRTQANGTKRWIDETFERSDPFELLCWLFFCTIPLRPDDEVAWDKTTMKPHTVQRLLVSLCYHTNGILRDLCLRLTKVETSQPHLTVFTSHLGLRKMSLDWSRRLETITERIRGELLEWRTKISTLAPSELPPNASSHILVGSITETWFCDGALSERSTQALSQFIDPLPEANLLNCAYRLVNPVPFDIPKSCTLSTPLFSVPRLQRGATAQFQSIIGSTGTQKNRLHGCAIPSEVSVSKDGRARLLSYVRDIHPTRSPQVYAALEDVLTACVPLLDRVCSSLMEDMPPVPFNFTPEWSLRGRTIQVAVAIDRFSTPDSSDTDVSIHPPSVAAASVTGGTVSKAVAMGLFVVASNHATPPRLSMTSAGGCFSSIDLVPGRCVAMPGYAWLYRIEGFVTGQLSLVWVYLMDPHAPVLSTMNVPPRRRDWIVEAVVPIVGEARGLPVGIQETIKAMLC